jgi:hypothetical protein
LIACHHAQLQDLVRGGAIWLAQTTALNESSRLASGMPVAIPTGDSSGASCR